MLILKRTVCCLLLVFAFLSLKVACVYAETIIPAGMLTQDTVWGGEVVVAGLVEVDAGVTLELQPGTVIQFKSPENDSEPSSGLIVYGNLTASGEETSPIRFYGQVHKPGSWKGVSLQKGHGKPNFMSYCRIEDAEVAISGDTSVLLAENVVVAGNSVGIVAGEGFDLTLKSSIILENGTGLELRQNSVARIINNQIVSNGDAGLILQGSSPIIKANIVKENGTVGIACYRGSSPEILDNQIVDHETGVVVEMMSSPQVLHNDIRDSQIGIGFGRMTFSRVEFNLIRNNDIGLFCNYSGYPNIHHNSIVNNKKYSVALGFKQSAMVSRMGPFKIRNEEFKDRSGPLKLRQHDTVAGQTLFVPEDGVIQATQNWWGKGVLSEMEVGGPETNISKIQDYYDKQTVTFKGEIYNRDRFNYSPWRSEPPVDVGPRMSNVGVKSGTVGDLLIAEKSK